MRWGGSRRAIVSVRVRIPSVSSALALVLACGCGGDDGKPSGPAVTVPASGPLSVRATEYDFDPARVVVEGEGRLRIELRNDGSLAHNLKLRRDGENTGGTRSLPPGTGGSAALRLLSGRYELVCTVGDHEELGMTGTVQVKE